MIPRIRQIQVSHYKSLGRAVVDLEPFTALVGLNGAGKSNFLDALAFVRDCLQGPIERACQGHGALRVFSHWQSFSSDHAFSLGIRLLIDLPDGSRADYAFQTRGNWNIEYKVVYEKCVITFCDQSCSSFEIIEGKFLHEVPGIRPQLGTDRLALSVISAAEEFAPLFEFLVGVKIYSIEPARMEQLTDLAASDSLERDGSNAAAVLKSLQDKAPEVHSRIERLMAKAVHGVDGVSARVFGESLLLDFSIDVGEDESASMQARSMSAGTLRVLGILLAIYQLKKATVLMIEEPEATIHPAAAEIITQVLIDAAQDRQVLITTHSPDLLDFKEIRDDQIRVVTMEQGRTIIAPMSLASRQAVRDHLYTPGELLRAGELGQDIEEAKRASEGLAIFAPPPSPSS